jgi:hypothetical protein
VVGECVLMAMSADVNGDLLGKVVGFHPQFIHTPNFHHDAHAYKKESRKVPSKCKTTNNLGF